MVGCLKTIVALAILILASGQAVADPVSDFYKGRQMRFVVGFGPGGGFDLFARLIARHIGKYIPGNPPIIVENRPGAASIVAANYLYAIAPKDGSVIATFSRDLPLLAVMGVDPSVQFDPRKFVWLGSPTSYADDGFLLWVRDDAPIKTIDDLRRPGGPRLVIAATSPGSTANDSARLLADTLGLNLRIVSGYPDNMAISLAIDRGEADGSMMGLIGVAAARPEWLKPGSRMRVLLQYARATRLEQFPNVPTARELAPNASARALITAAEIPFRLAVPLAAPPGIPPERAQALKSAFLAVQKDPEYIEQAKAANVALSPISGDEIMDLVNQFYRLEPAALDYFKTLHAQTGRK